MEPVRLTLHPGGSSEIYLPQECEEFGYVIKEQHLRKVVESLTDAIAAAEVAGISNDELKGILEALLDVDK